MGDANKAGRIDRRSLLRGMLAGGAAGATMGVGAVASGDRVIPHGSPGHPGAADFGRAIRGEPRRSGITPGPATLIMVPSPLLLTKHSRESFPIEDILDLLGSVNGVPMWGYPAGSLIFNRCSSDPKYGELDPDISEDGRQWTKVARAWLQFAYEFNHRESGWQDDPENPRGGSDFSILFNGDIPTEVAVLGEVTRPRVTDPDASWV